MAVTRDPNFPVEIAALMQAFNHCADGHSAETVINATLQMAGAAIGFICKNRGADRVQVELYTTHICELLTAIVRDNWERTPLATDIEVKLG
ncbi:hypothetical protein ACRQ5Q_22580 [Bradyrhizobium sp. PMVTL-01]|uniref:hypothetical protein n=1 Tax=Bradyrhizobium sp. PMVTL-01 TaxID=3434999 RepID=UPI003F72FC7E